MVAAAQESETARAYARQVTCLLCQIILSGQWASEYLRLYPSGKYTCRQQSGILKPGNRKKFCGRIATGDYDAVIIGHSQFEKIPMSIGRQREQSGKAA